LAQASVRRRKVKFFFRKNGRKKNDDRDDDEDDDEEDDGPMFWQDVGELEEEKRSERSRVTSDSLLKSCAAKPRKKEHPATIWEMAKSEKRDRGIVHQSPISVLRRAEKPKGSLGSFEEDKRAAGWRMLSIAVDSGACDNVIGPQELPDYEGKIVETRASKNGDDFVSASGDVIPNYGELRIMMVTREQTSRSMAFQAAGVAKPLGSVKRMLHNFHRVVFDEEGSYILNKKSGEVNWLREEDGNFMLDVWVPPPAVAEASGFHGQP